MSRLPNTRLARDVIRKVGLISSPASSECAALALIELVRSGELAALIDFTEMVLSRKPEGYIDRKDLLCAKPGISVPVELVGEGDEFAFAAYVPVFLGSVTEQQ